jgi:hypothetical protein
VSDAILADPVSYLDNPQDSYGKALQIALAEYQNPKDFNALLLEQPAALGNYINSAKDGCKSEYGS